MSDFKVVLPVTTEEWQRDMRIAYNQALDDCIDKFADILSSIKYMCGRNCPVNCNWGTTNCKDMCKKWLAEQLKGGGKNE